MLPIVRVCVPMPLAASICLRLFLSVLRVGLSLPLLLPPSLMDRLLFDAFSRLCSSFFSLVAKPTSNQIYSTLPRNKIL